MKKNSHKFYLSFLLLLFAFHPASIFAQLSGTKTIGGATPDYATIKAAILDLNTQGVTAPGVTFLIRGGTYAEDSLRIRTSTSSVSAPIIFKPDVGATVVINVSPPNTTYNFAIKIDTTQYVTIDGSNNGTTSRDLTINSNGTSGQRGIWVSGASHFTTIKNCNVNAGKGIASPTTSVRCIDFLYTGVGQDPDNIICENNFIRYAYFGVRMEGNAASDVMENAIVRNNVVDSVANSGIYSHYQNNSLIYNNDVNIRRGSSATMYGIYVGTVSSNVKVYSNKVYDLNQLSTTSVTYGIYNGASSTTGINAIYNNFVRAINLPATGTGAMYGIYSGTGNTTTPDVFAFNTVYLTGASSGNRITAAFYKGSATGPANVYNNIFYNTRTDGTTGVAVAIYKTSTGTVLNSNNNNLYVGTPDAQHQTGRISTTNYSTVALWGAANGGSDGSSFAENSPFVSTTDLHIQTGVPTQLESGGIPIAGITEDIDGNTRNITTPDIGGDEFAGIALDLTPPSITFTPLAYTSSTSARTLTSAISDAGSGVPTAGIGLPVLYWRINSGTWNAATASYLSGSDYQFTFGTGVAIGDTVKYYICAQDNATTPNVTSNPLTGAGGFTSNPPAAAVPPTTPASYLITNTSLSGDYTVGIAMFNSITGRNIYFEKVVQKVVKEVEVLVPLSDVHDENAKLTGNISPESSKQLTSMKQLMEVEETTWIPMENGIPYLGDLFVKKVEHPEINFPDGTDGIYSTITAAVADLNLRGVAGPVRFLLTDADYSTGETFPIVIDIGNENQPTAINTVTFKPNTGVTSTITSSTAQFAFAINGCDYIIFDGSNIVGGTTRDLIIVNNNTVTANLGVVLFHDGLKGATYCTVKNCIIKGSPTPATSYGLFLNAAGGGFHNTSFTNNIIKNFRIGIQFAGVAGNKTNDGLISDNIVGDVTEPLTNSGILGSQVDNLSITGNEIFGQIEGNTITSKYGISLITGSTNCKIQKNNIHDFYYNGTGGWGCFGIRYNSDATTFTEISNNVIHNIKSDGDASSLTYTPAGIYIISGGNVGVYYNSIYMSGNTLGAGTTYDGRSACLTIAAGITLLDIRDNIFQNSMGSFPGSTRTNTTYGVYSSSANTAFTFINYNDYFVNGINPYVGYLGANQVDLAAWRIATGQDVNSISADPLYQSLTDLRPAYNSPVIAAGTPIAGITTDFLGVTRSATTPTIGAYEQGVIIPIAAGTYTVGLSAFMQATGKNIYFETRTRTVTKDLLGDDAEIDILAYDEKNGTQPIINENQRYVTVTEEYLEMMEDGKPFDYSFFKSDQSMGVYPTITSAIADLVLRGIAGPVTFLLVDTNYPTETYPLLIPAIVGASATNTITFKPGPGVQANVPGSPTQPTSTFQLGGADYVIIDGSNTVGGTTKDLHITSLIAAPAFHFFGGSSHNLVMNTIFDSKYTSTASGTLIFGASASGDSNYVGNCTMTKNDTSAVRQGVGVYFFSSNTSTFNKVVGCAITEFNNYGIRVQGAPSTNNLIKGNTIEHINPSTVTTNYGIYISRQPGLVIEENYIKNLRSTVASPTLTAIYFLGSSGNPVDIYVRNNVISLSAEFNSPAGTLRGIDYFAFAANSAEIYFNTIYIAGTGVTGGTSTGITKRDATTSYKAYDNAIYNTRSNGTGTGKHYAVYFSNTTAPFEMNNNDYFADGTGGVFGYFGTSDVLTLAAWQGLTSQDANSISANPIFVSNLDYRPQTVSPLLGAGLPISGITTDILGAPRGTPPTIGAYENGVFVAINSPSNLTAIPDTFTVDLGWQDNSNNEFGFVIQRKLGDSLSVNPWLNIDTVNANVINYLDTGLSPNTMYSYRVFGYNSSGNSGFSNIVTTTTFIPVELTTFKAELSGREIIVSWVTATELNNRGFDIERKMDGEWEKIGFKEGRGTSTTESSYSFVDKFTYESFVGTVTYRLKQMDFDGSYAYLPEVEVDVDFTPKEYTLYQNYPNPFNPVTTIKYALPFESNVRIAVYNILGEMVDVLVDETKQVGFHDFNWNASNLASGIYIYTIEAKSVAGDKNYSSVKKMILMK